ncbi:LacI family DNA-binding transcriptional regulator [uncultured Victivallis sp.]|uniref:LacI family DNA-binding transcriptional regulator n=1 Tax=uncultured Victivallis sp. TaxID=354118 RepID=UPI0025F3723B|nr:LacI family DNA-binding transcriptional regulator [uncultured Victivallis sp.]
MKRSATGKPVTLKQIAELTHCSVAAVSTALNNPQSNSGVSAERRARIKAAAAKLGYHPNFASRSLRQARSRTIGVYVQPKVWRDIGNDYEISIFKGIERAAVEHGYDILVLNMNSQILPEICAERLAERRIDGLILLHADRRADWIDQLAAISDCVVAVDCCDATGKLSRVLFDDVAAIRMAVKHLADLGHRRIGYAGVCTVDGLEEAADRETPFRAAVAEFGLDQSAELIHNIDNCEPLIDPASPRCQLEGCQAMRYFLSLPVPPTAVVAYNSMVATMMLHEARKRKVKVPGELSIIGIDDYAYLHMLETLPTVVDHRLPELGYAGGTMLIDLIEGKLAAPALQMLGPELLPGETTARLQNCDCRISK